MFHFRTLFILGAGASHEAGLPTGTDLKKDIARRLNFDLDSFGKIEMGDREIWEALVRHAGRGDMNPYLSSGRQIAAAMPLANSIDTFIDNHRENEHIKLCGKLAIVRSIMEAERKSKLYVDPRSQSIGPPKPNFDKISDTWFVKLFQILHDGVAKADIDSLFGRVSFINFNYDRCIERFLVKAILVSYGINEDKAQDIVRRVTIFHPYGTIGQLPWQGAQDPMLFGGSDKRPDVLLKLSQRIRTYTEQVEEAATLTAMRQEVAQADIIAFLGFGFHEENMELITPTSAGETKYQRVYATAKGISEADCNVVKGQINNILEVAHSGRGRNIYVKNELTCAALFDTYWRTFSLG